jgi:hypothetical protein
MLFTEEEINTAMLKRMIKDELTHHDSRFYKFKETSWETSLEILKSALGRHSIKKVREIQWDKDPRTTEVWYYAQVKGRKDHLVVRLSVWKDHGTMAVFVASESLLLVTGFLAELRHGIAEELKKRSLLSTAFIPILEHEATSIVGRHPLLIMMVSESEIEVEDTEQR